MCVCVHTPPTLNCEDKIIKIKPAKTFTPIAKHSNIATGLRASSKAQEEAHFAHHSSLYNTSFYFLEFYSVQETEWQNCHW